MAAIRYVTTGAYLNLIKEYEAIEVKPELEGIKTRLVELAKIYADAVEKVTAIKEPAYVDFMARRMVEMAADIIMGHLLLQDAQRNDSFTESAKVYCNFIQAEVVKHAEFIANFKFEDLEAYKKA